MLNLKKLVVSKCVVKAENIADFFNHINTNTGNSSPLQELTIDFHSITAITVDKLLTSMLAQNTSLRSLEILRSVRLPIDVTLALLEVIGRHAKLVDVSIEGSNLRCSSDS